MSARNPFDQTAIAKVEPCTLEFPENPIADEMAVPLPPVILDPQGRLKGGLTEVSGLTPTATFIKIGDHVFGRYVGARILRIPSGRDDHGEPVVRSQFMYDLNVSNWPTSIGASYTGIVSVWGSAALDQRMKAAEDGGLKKGGSVLIQYIGEMESGKGNPAKLYRVVYAGGTGQSS